VLNHVPGDSVALESLIKGKDVPVYPFQPMGAEACNMTDDDYQLMVQKEFRLANEAMFFKLF
jgi:anthranilate synthase component 1